MVDARDKVAVWIALVFAASLLYFWIGTAEMCEAMCKVAFPPAGQLMLMAVHLATTLDLVFRNYKMQEAFEAAEFVVQRLMTKTRILEHRHAEEIQYLERLKQRHIDVLHDERERRVAFYEDILEHCTCNSYTSYLESQGEDGEWYESESYESESTTF